MSLFPIAEARSSGIVEGLDKLIPGGFENILFFGITIGALAAVGVIIYAGILYAASGDNSSKQKEAREWIWAAVKGLAVLVFGYLIINLANPKLTTIEEIDIVDPPVPEVGDQSALSTVTPGSGSSYNSVPLIKQAGGSWGGKIYGKGPGCDSNYAASGCGPTSLAMAVLFLTGNRYMDAGNAVPTIGDLVVSKGMRICGEGTTHSAMDRIPAEYGLTSKRISSKSAISSCLKDGGVVIGIMRGVTDAEEASLKKTDKSVTPIFTKYGHFIVVTGIDEGSDKFFINDPGGRNITSSDTGHYLKYANVNWCISK